MHTPVSPYELSERGKERAYGRLERAKIGSFLSGLALWNVSGGTARRGPLRSHSNDRMGRQHSPPSTLEGPVVLPRTAGPPRSLDRAALAGGGLRAGRAQLQYGHDQAPRGAAARQRSGEFGRGRIEVAHGLLEV